MHVPAAALFGRSRRSPTFAPKHYHGPGGLNGRVRDGNGCDPAGMVAENPGAGRSGPAPADAAMVGHDESVVPRTPFGLVWARPTFDPLRIGEAVCWPPERSGRVAAGGRSGWSSCSAVRTGRLRRSPAVHARPIDLVVFQEPVQLPAGNLISEGASRLDAFSAYPLPTWLPGDAPSGTAGTPEVGPPQSSRTRGDSPQVSYAHGR